MCMSSAIVYWWMLATKLLSLFLFSSNICRIVEPALFPPLLVHDRRFAKKWPSSMHTSYQWRDYRCYEYWTNQKIPCKICKCLCNQSGPWALCTCMDSTQWVMDGLSMAYIESTSLRPDFERSNITPRALIDMHWLWPENALRGYWA